MQKVLVNGPTHQTMDTTTDCVTQESVMGRKGLTARMEHFALQSVGNTLYWRRVLTRTFARTESGLLAATNVYVS